MATYPTYSPNPFVAENTFLQRPPQRASLPDYEAFRSVLPQPWWDGHESTLSCYWKVWDLAFQNLQAPAPESGFCSNFIDTAFNDCIFMWDSAFILMFARYGMRGFHFQGTLDNFYAKQHPDGFICREIAREDGSDRFERHDPAGTGPNVLAWCEWEYFLNTGDTDRLAAVAPALLGYNRWFQRNRAWQDGSYWSSGWGCGMDNLPRQPEGFHRMYDHGFLSWVDTTLQQILSDRILVDMCRILGRNDEIEELNTEIAGLVRYVNDVMWDPEEHFYFDRYRDGSLHRIKTVGSYWALMAEAVPEARIGAFVTHLEDEAAFNRPHRVPALAADHPSYAAFGDYWNGGVWPPTNYMVLRGLTKAEFHDLAHRIARNHLDNVVRVFEETDTVWENYAPESPAPGKPAKQDFVGWSGLPAVAVLFEYVFGIRPSVPERVIRWDVRLTEAHGVAAYPFGPGTTVDLRCEARRSDTEEPKVRISANEELTVLLSWAGGERTLRVPAS